MTRDTDEPICCGTDGGGVRGICSLVVLQALMRAIKAAQQNDILVLEDDWDDNDKPENQDLPLPHDYFDLAGGTSTGG